MKIPRIYLDTSVIGGCFDEEFAVWSNGLFQDFQQSSFTAVTSDLVATEIEAALKHVQKKFAQLLTLSTQVLKVTEQALSLGERYQEKRILSPQYYNDCLHIAIATVAEVDVLVSWNFKHIVHFNKIRLFNSVNMEMGYKPLQIYSPREVTIYGAESEN